MTCLQVNGLTQVQLLQSVFKLQSWHYSALPWQYLASDRLLSSKSALARSLVPLLPWAAAP